jgi:hypothetical protein
MSFDGACTIDFCACIPPNNDISQCDDEFDLDYKCRASTSSTGLVTQTAVCYAYQRKIIPVLTCNQGKIQRFEVVKNPVDLGFSNEETLWSCNSFTECEASIPLCSDITITNAPTGAPIDVIRTVDITSAGEMVATTGSIPTVILVTAAAWIARWVL